VASTRFDRLVLQLEWLRKHLLPYKFDPTGSYFHADKVIIRASSYRVLSHAEFESYVESRAVTIARRALERWKKESRHSAPLSSLIAFSEMKLPRPPDYINRRAKDQKDWDDLVSPEKRIERIVSAFVDYVESENHGIREKNLSKMLIPIGVDLRRVKATDLATIDDFGKKRGSTAHSSASAYIKAGIDPKTEHDRVMGVLKSFHEIDVLVSEVEAGLEE
jgi:hypothetical protein